MPVEPKVKKPRKPPTARKGVAKGDGKLNRHYLENGLTVEQEAYCRARAMGMNMAESMMAIGGKYTVALGRDWERENPKVRARIEELSAIATENAILKTGLNREWVISRLMSVVERCMQAEPVLDKKGEPTGGYEFDSTGANQALKMLGDTMGLFKPAERKPEDDYANLTDEDLTRIIGSLAAETGLVEIGAGAPAPTVHKQAVKVQALRAPD